MASKARKPDAGPKPLPAPADPHASELAAVVERFIWKADDGTAAIASGTDQGTGDPVRMVGPLLGVAVGESLHAKGGWSRHPKYGYQFKVKSFETTRPAGREGIKAVLCSSLTGVGPVLAEKIVAKFGPDKVWDVLDENPERLREVAGVSDKKAGQLISQWENTKVIREVRVFLREHGASDALTSRIYKAYGQNSIARLTENPFRLTDLDRVGFVTADKIAAKMGIAAADPRRVDAGIVYALQKAEKEGNCFLPLADLLASTREALKLDSDAELIAERVRVTSEQGNVVVEPSLFGDRHVYTPRMHRHETGLAGCLRSMAESRGVIGVPADLPWPQEDFEPTELQRQAVEFALRYRLSVLRGGPGTGKTTTLKVLCDLMDNMGLKIALCAPTGKAAKRMSEATGHDAKTIHRLLKWDPQSGGFVHCRRDPLPFQVVVVDECSMLDLRLAYQLFDAIGPSTHVVLVGDTDQLPPVGAGKVFHDIILSKRAAVTTLTKIFRQAARSMIIQAAYQINRGKPPVMDPAEVAAHVGVKPEDMLEDFFFLARNENDQILEAVVDYACGRIPRRFGLDPFDDVQVIAPQRNGAIGVDALNAALQDRLNPDGAPIGAKTFRVGDKLLNKRNDYTHDIMNGESARIAAYDRDDALVTLEVDNGRRVQMGSADVAENMVLGYAITVHAAQGTQAPAVIAVLSNSHYMMLSRNLTYTAVTRAKELCMIIGAPKALTVACRTEDTSKRFTALAERLVDPSLSGQLL